MLNLLLAVLSSALVSVAMRLSKPYVKKETALLAVNYLLCSLLSFAQGTQCREAVNGGKHIL